MPTNILTDITVKKTKPKDKPVQWGHTLTFP